MDPLSNVFIVTDSIPGIGTKPKSVLPVIPYAGLGELPNIPALGCCWKLVTSSNPEKGEPPVYCKLVSPINWFVPLNKTYCWAKDVPVKPDPFNSGIRSNLEDDIEVLEANLTQEVLEFKYVNSWGVLFWSTPFPWISCLREICCFK